MILTKKTILTIIGLFTLQFAIAQNSLKEPVSFKLKNGITVIVAENIGMEKIYASLTTDNNLLIKESVYENLDRLLNAKAKDALTETFGKSDKKIIPFVKFKNAEANVASDIEDFNATFSIMSATVRNLSINENSIDKSISIADVKALYIQKFAPSKTVITIAGDITFAQTKVLAKKAFGDLKEDDFLATK